jgi:hypothetical protein
MDASDILSIESFTHGRHHLLSRLTLRVELA